MKKGTIKDSFQNELSRFMDKAGPFTHPSKKVKTLQKSMVRSHVPMHLSVDLFVHMCEVCLVKGSGGWIRKKIRRVCWLELAEGLSRGYNAAYWYSHTVQVGDWWGANFTWMPRQC